MARYIRNAKGAVHDVTDDHFKDLLFKGSGATKYPANWADLSEEEVRNQGGALPPGWSEIDEDEAREANPALFGIPTPEGAA